MKLFSHFSNHLGAHISRHEPEGVRVLADMYWRVLISFTTLLAAASLAYGVWGLLRVLGELNTAARVSAPPPPALKRATIDATIRGFENRRTQFELLKTSPGENIPDPSK